MKNRIVIGIALMLLSIVTYRTMVQAGITASKPTSTFQDKEAIADKPIILPGIFNVRGIFSNGTITSKGLEIDPQSTEPFTRQTYQEILSNPDGAILGLVVTRLNNKIVYNVYNGFDINRWLQSNNIDPTNKKAIIKVKYYITSSASDSFEIVSGPSSHLNSLLYAVQGLAEAQVTITEYFLEKEQYNLAKKWLDKAINQGSTWAQMRLAQMYKDGLGVEQNYEYAIFLYESALQNGDIEAAALLGQMYEMGQGVTQDYYKAYSLYRKFESKRHSHSNPLIERVFTAANPALKEKIKNDETTEKTFKMQSVDSLRELIPYGNHMVAIQLEPYKEDQGYYQLTETEDSKIIYGYLRENESEYSHTMRYILQPLIKIPGPKTWVWEPILNNHLPLSIKRLTPEESLQIGGIIKSGIAKYEWPNIEQY